MVILGQFALTQYGTYGLFSWDIMEPITCAMSLGDAIAAYFFWIWTKKNYGISGVKEFYEMKKRKKLAKREGYIEDQFTRVQSSIEVM